MHYLIQIYLPLDNNDGVRFERERFAAVERTFTKAFGGFTAYSRAPAAGAWVSAGAEIQRDDIIVYEVIAKEFDRDWWKEYRRQLEESFDQDRVLIRGHGVEVV